MYTDRSIACADCGQEFTFTSGEQEFYAQRGFTESPKRCPSCRQIRKAQRSRSSSYDSGSSRGDSYGGSRYGNSNGGYDGASNDSGGYGGGYSSAPGYSPSGGYSAGGYSGGGGSYAERRPREMYEAVCANCGKTASVPFRPSGSKPVYCSDCFESRR